jgi:hypothetical protein
VVGTTRIREEEVVVVVVVFQLLSVSAERLGMVHPGIALAASDRGAEEGGTEGMVGMPRGIRLR